MTGWLHYRNRKDLDGPSTYWLANGLTRDDVMADAHVRVDLGHTVDIHHHPAGRPCTNACERLTAGRRLRTR